VFWIYLILVLVFYGFTRSVLVSVFLGVLASIALVYVGSVF